MGTDLLGVYLTYLRSVGRSPATLKGATSALRQAERSTGRRLETWDTDVAWRWWHSLAGKAPTTRAWHLSMVRGFVRWALRHDLIAVDPTRRLEAPRRRKALPRPAPEPDVAVALAATDGRIRFALLAAGDGGLRRAEIAGLRPEDVDTRAATIRVRGKGGRERMVPLHPALADALRRLPADDTGPTLLGLTEYHLGRLVRQELDGLGLGWRLHALRHRFGTRIYAATRDPIMVRDLLGHASIATTEGYVQVTPDRRTADAVKGL